MKLFFQILFILVIASFAKQSLCQTLGNTNLYLIRGDSRVFEFNYYGNVTADELLFVVKRDTAISSVRLIQKKNILAGGDTNQITASYKKPFTKIKIKFYPIDTEDLLRNKYVFDLTRTDPADSTDHTHLFIGYLNLQPTISTPGDGASVPLDGTRFYFAGLDSTTKEPGIPVFYNSDNSMDYWSVEQTKDTFDVYDSSQVDARFDVVENETDSLFTKTQDIEEGLRELQGFNIGVSKMGDDSNSGLSLSKLKLTLSSAAIALSDKQTLGLIHSGLWREQLTLNLDSITIKSINNLSKISGGEVQTGWNLTGGLTNCYQKSIGHSITSLSAGRNYNNILVAEITTADTGIKPYSSRKLLKLVANTTAVDTIPGSYFYTVANPSIVYIHPSNSSDPDAGVYYYEVSTRDHAIENGAGDSYIYDGLRLNNLHLLLSGNGAGLAQSGDNVQFFRTIFQDGGTHHTVFNSGIVDECVFLGGVPNYTEASQLVLFENIGVGNVSVIKNSIMFPSHIPLYAHISGADTNNSHEQISYFNLRIFGEGARRGHIGNDFVKRTYIEDVYVENIGGLYSGTSKIVSIKNSIAKDVRYLYQVNNPTTYPIYTIIDNVLAKTSLKAGDVYEGLIYSNQTSKTITVTNSILFIDSEIATGGGMMFDLDTNSVINVNNTIMIFKAAGTTTDVLQTAANGQLHYSDTRKFNNNVYILLSPTSLRFLCLNPTIGYVNFASWVNHSGQDSNSIFLDFTSTPEYMDSIFIDYKNGNWQFNVGTNLCDSVLSITQGMRTPPKKYIDRPTYDDAVYMMLNGELRKRNLLPTIYEP